MIKSRQSDRSDVLVSERDVIPELAARLEKIEVIVSQLFSLRDAAQAREQIATHHTSARHFERCADLPVFRRPIKVEAR